jgi:hypothetical protein
MDIEKLKARYTAWLQGKVEDGNLPVEELVFSVVRLKSLVQQLAELCEADAIDEADKPIDLSQIQGEEDDDCTSTDPEIVAIHKVLRWWHTDEETDEIAGAEKSVELLLALKDVGIVLAFDGKQKT